MADAFAAEPLLDTATAAKRLGVSPSFLAKARMQGVGPRYRKLGRAVRYAHADVDHWLSVCSRTSTAEQPAVTEVVRKASKRRRSSPDEADPLTLNA
jgi:predicted DNA-binding transcriptional regulator AlpA